MRKNTASDYRAFDHRSLIWVVVLCLLGFVLTACQNSTGDLVESEPTVQEITPSITPDIQATQSKATHLASTATSASQASQTVEALATGGAITATAAYQQSATAAAEATMQAKETVTQLAQQATEQANQVLLAAAGKICQGEGIAEAASYIEEPVFHPIIIFPDTYPYPAEARPENLAALQLVACIQENEFPTGEFANYIINGEPGYLCLEFIKSYVIEVRIAQTGEIIYSDSIWGGPNPCGGFEEFPPGTREKIKSGPLPDPALVWEWISELVFLDKRE